MERINILGNQMAHPWLEEVSKICEGAGEEVRCRNCNSPHLGYRYQTVARKTRVGDLEETRLWLWCSACQKYGLVAGVKMPESYQEPAEGAGWWDGYREDIQRNFPHLAEEFQRQVGREEPEPHLSHTGVRTHGARQERPNPIGCGHPLLG